MGGDTEVSLTPTLRVEDEVFDTVLMVVFSLIDIHPIRSMIAVQT